MKLGPAEDGTAPVRTDQGGQKTGYGARPEYPLRGSGVKIADLGKPGDPNSVETAWNISGVNQVRIRFRDGRMWDFDGWRLRELAEAAMKDGAR
ncbi:MAG: hypothetical protein ACT4P5_02300 [Armatimonadota bacterium]